jgi:LmbE family N-acetylglucosaminyl deacetylase
MVQRSIMAIGAHADDIEINIGGTCLKDRERGYDLIYVMSTNNMSGRFCKITSEGKAQWWVPPYDELQLQRKREAQKAADWFGAGEVIHLDHPQRHFTRHDGSKAEIHYGIERPDCVPPQRPTILTAHEHPEHVQHLADLILKHNPEAVITHGPIMADMEHVGTCLLVSKAYLKAIEAGYTGMLVHWLDTLKDLPHALFGKSYLRWDSFIDISGYWERKLDSVEIHACQIPDARRLTLPAWGPACGCQHAEAVTIVHWGKQPEHSSAFAFELAGNA